MNAEEAIDEKTLQLAGISRFDILARKSELRSLSQGVEKDKAQIHGHQYATAIFLTLATKEQNARTI